MSRRPGDDLRIQIALERPEPNSLPQVFALIPALNEEKAIAKVVLAARQIVTKVIVCDDGSTDMTSDIARALGAVVIRHSLNLGKGDALRTLIGEALKFRPDIVVTMDGDGQHDPSEIPALVAPILRGEADIVVGVRQIEASEMPRDRAVGNRILGSFTDLKAGNPVRDTQCGFRAYSLHAIQVLPFTAGGMAVESQTLIDATKLELRIAEVPVSTIYEGPAKRSPVSHASEVIDYLLVRTIIHRPLFYLGIPSLLLLLAGLIAGFRVVQIFSVNHQIAVGTGLISAMLLIVGTVLLATSLILKLLRIRIQ